MNTYEQNVPIVMPKGELEKPSYDALRKIGIIIPEKYNKLYRRTAENFPVVFIDPRASDVPGDVFAEDSEAVAGITGSDILWENGYNRGRIGSEVPVELFFPEVKQPLLYLGVTKTFSDDVRKKTGREVIPTDLSGRQLFTKYTTVAGDFIKDNNVEDVRITYRGGGIEAAQYIYPSAVSLVDIWVSGNTARDNNVVNAATIAPVVTTFFENKDKTSAFQQGVIDDIRNKLLIEAQRLRTPTTAFA